MPGQTNNSQTVRQSREIILAFHHHRRMPQRERGKERDESQSWQSYLEGEHSDICLCSFSDPMPYLHKDPNAGNSLRPQLIGAEIDFGHFGSSSSPMHVCVRMAMYDLSSVVNLGLRGTVVEL